MLRVSLIFAALISSCQKDETISGYADPSATWVLQSIGATNFPARATITFPQEGVISGQAPCNSYTAQQSVPYPWFKADAIAQTKRACPELSAERDFFSNLSSMTLAEVGGRTLILSNDEGLQMVFSAE